MFISVILFIYMVGSSKTLFIFSFCLGHFYQSGGGLGNIYDFSIFFGYCMKI